MKNFKKLVALLFAILLSASIMTSFTSCNSEKYTDLEKKVGALESDLNTIGSKADAEALNEVKAQLTSLSDKVSALSDGVSPDKLKDVTDKLSEIDNELSALSGSISAAKLTELNTKLDDLAAKLAALTPQAPVEPLLAFDYGEECYEKIKYIDALLRDRDCFNGKNFALAVKWIKWNLIQAGYSEDEIIEQDFTITKYYKKDTDLKTALSAVKGYETDGKLYARSGRNYVESAEGTYVKVNITMANIMLVKKGKSDDQIIIGAHFDGTGTGDNGSGIALALTTAQKVHDIETPNTLVFVFFNAEEIGCYGSTACANALTKEEIDKTLYMINLDSLVCGDYCCLYSGVQDNSTKTVTDAWPYYNAIDVASSIGLTFHTNPWTWEAPAPGYTSPDYASPSTGDWSDHLGFKKVGIPYLYFEATNWYIPGPYKEYDGYGETYLIGMLMNTPNDYLDYIEKYFPGRILSHISQFSALLNALVLQENVSPSK